MPQIDLTAEELATLIESLTYSMRWMSEQRDADPTPETRAVRRANVDRLKRLKQKLRTVSFEP